MLNIPAFPRFGCDWTEAFLNRKWRWQKIRQSLTKDRLYYQCFISEHPDFWRLDACWVTFFLLFLMTSMFIEGCRRSLTLAGGAAVRWRTSLNHIWQQTETVRTKPSPWWFVTPGRRQTAQPSPPRAEEEGDAEKRSQVSLRGAAPAGPPLLWCVREGADPTATWLRDTPGRDGDTTTRKRAAPQFWTAGRSGSGWPDCTQTPRTRGDGGGRDQREAAMERKAGGKLLRTRFTCDLLSRSYQSPPTPSSLPRVWLRDRSECIL